ncbi:hypothetical protein KDN24_04595 [Bacillus sp. Bva_UNVM-123]
MRKQRNQNEGLHEEKDKQNERQLISDFSNPENKQPVPQPKDFEDIEY